MTQVRQLRPTLDHNEEKVRWISDFRNSFLRFCEITRRMRGIAGSRLFSFRVSFNQKRLRSTKSRVFLTVHSARLFTETLRELELRTTKLYRIAIYKKVRLCLALAQSISMITRHTPNAIQINLFGILKNTRTGKHA